MGPTRVLVVDDKESFIEMAKFVLTSAGHVVDATSGADSARSNIPAFLATEVRFWLEGHGSTRASRFVWP